VFDVGLPEFFVLGVVALLVFGPERLPEVAVQAARLIRRLRGMAESARSELTADLEPHMRELRELKELDPRKMAKRYVLDPVEEDGTLAELRGKGLRDSLRGGRSPNKTKTVGPAAPVGPGAADGAEPIGGAANGSANGPANGPAATDADAGGPPSDGPGTNGPGTNGPALPPAMAPALTPAGQRPPYDVDAT